MKCAQFSKAVEYLKFIESGPTIQVPTGVTTLVDLVRGLFPTERVDVYIAHLS